MSFRTGPPWLRHAFIGILTIAVILLAAAAKRSLYPTHPGPASHLSKLVKMSECRTECGPGETAVLHPPAVILKSDFTLSAAPRIRVQLHSVVASVALLSPPLRV